MASSLPNPEQCCSDSCDDPLTTSVQGPKGDAGADGSDGSDGQNAFTNTSSDFTMPAEGADVTADVDNSDWASATQVVYVQNAGYMEVRSKPSSTQIVLRNLEDTGNSEYTGNVAPGTTVASGSNVQPGGLQGPAGSDGSSGAPTDATYWTRTANGTLTNESAIDTLSDGVIEHTGGTPSQAALCTAIEGLGTNGLVVRSGSGSAQARTITGTASEISVADGAGVSGNPTLSLDSGVYRSGGTDVAVTDGGTGASSASGARSNLGFNATAVEYIELRHEETSGTDGGSITSGSYQTRTLNNEVADSGNHVSLSSNQFTLDAGTYQIFAKATVTDVDSHKLRLRNISDASTTLTGLTGNAPTGSGNEAAFLSGRFTIGNSKTFELQHRIETSVGATDGGSAASFGDTETYVVVQLWKEG